MFKKDPKSIPKITYKFEFNPEGIKLNGKTLNSSNQINHVPEYLFGKTIKIFNSLNLQNYIIQSELQRGGSDITFLGLEKKTNKKVLFQFLISNEPNFIDGNSIVLHLILNIPEIVKFIGIYIPEDQYFEIPPENNKTGKSIHIRGSVIAWEYPENGNAFTHIDKYLLRKDDNIINPTIR